jgi:hypothetical protein
MARVPVGRWLTHRMVQIRCSGAQLAHCSGGLGVGGSNPLAPTIKRFKISETWTEPPFGRLSCFWLMSALGSTGKSPRRSRLIASGRVRADQGPTPLRAVLAAGPELIADAQNGSHRQLFQSCAWNKACRPAAVVTDRAAFRLTAPSSAASLLLLAPSLPHHD